MSIIMAHCHHVLKEGEDVSYQFDFQGLEKQFLNECVYGKPHIEVKELPHMVYRMNVYTAPSALSEQCPGDHYTNSREIQFDRCGSH